jgi:CheY-like chemotaxis protein
MMSQTNLEALRGALAQSGFDVMTAADGKSALEIFQAYSARFDLLVTDVAMTPMNGCDVATACAKLNPRLNVVFVSGYVGAHSLQYHCDLVISNWTFVRKPVSREELRYKVREACGTGVPSAQMTRNVRE